MRPEHVAIDIIDVFCPVQCNQMAAFLATTPLGAPVAAGGYKEYKQDWCPRRNAWGQGRAVFARRGQSRSRPGIQIGRAAWFALAGSAEIGLWSACFEWPRPAAAL